MVVCLVISVLSLCTSLVSANNSFHCNAFDNRIIVCPESVLAFVCSVSDGIATVWKGSIFNCPSSGNEIILRHSTFENRAIGTCNNGAVVAYSTEVTNNSYTSRLNVTVSQEMHNGTVECIRDDFNVTSVGTCTLILETEPPGNARISNINPNQFTIHWSSPGSNNCPPVPYHITSTNCGVCPNITSNTSVTCTDISVDGRTCLVVIQTKGDGNNSEHSDAASTNLTIELQVPSAPEVTARWINQFQVFTSFNVTEPFLISNGIDGSATSYTLTYSDSTSGRICDSVTISASSCIGGIYNHIFDIPPACSMFTSIVVTVFATNVLGDGPSSNLVLLDFENNYFTHDQNASDTTFLYSIVGGSSIAVILFLMIVIIVIILLARFLKTHSQKKHPKSPCLAEDINLKKNECYEVTRKPVLYENIYHEIDKTLNLESLLIQIRDQVTPKWYQFGLAVGINKETLDEFSNFPPEECIIKMLDIWLKTSETAITWRDVANALKESGFHHLAEKILKVYKTGILPVKATVAMEQSFIMSRQHQ